MTDGIYAFDLLVPVRPLFPGFWTCSCGATLGPYTPLRDCRTKPDAHAGCRAKVEAERTARAAAEFEAAIAAWRQAGDQYADTPAVLAVLNLHQPTLGHASAECEHCERYDGMEGTEQVPWPCPTYAAIRDTTAERNATDSGADDADMSVKAEALPEVGETVHVWRKSGKIAGCCPMQVVGHCATESGTALALAGPLPWSPEFEQLLTSIHDETRTEHASWHWPCEGDRDAEPEPDALAPVNVTINVSGSVLSERDLRDVIRKQLLNLGGLTPTTFRR